MTILNNSFSDKFFIEGRLEGIGVPELIHRICLPGRTGTLTLARGEQCKTIYIKAGQLIFATSNFAEDRLGERLLRSGAIGYHDYEEAGRLVSGGKRLGAILVELGHLSPESLVRGVLEQVKEIILDLFPWEYGAYKFIEGPLPTTEVITLNIQTPRIIFDGIHRIGAWPRISAGVGSPRTMFRLTRDGRSIAEELHLGAAERLILEMLEEPEEVGEICRGVFLPNFEVYQALWAFRILGIMREVENEKPKVSVAHDGSGTRGTLSDTPIGEVLLRLCREGETGILYLARGGEEKAFHIQGGRLVFATSNRPEDHLTSYLLRRGVIGLRDRDDVERRLLSNKRAGTILREMGILSHDELVRFVREQLREIILSVFQWERGEWRFVSGDLPTLEGITLDRPVEEWVLHGVRRVRNWSRIRIGCGDLETVLKPAESPYAALSGVDLGSDESEVLAVLDVPRTVEKICTCVGIPDYRVGEILWALQMIGAIVRATSETLVLAPEKPVGAGASTDAFFASPEMFTRPATTLPGLAQASSMASGAAVEADRASAEAGRSDGFGTPSTAPSDSPTEALPADDESTQPPAPERRQRLEISELTADAKITETWEETHPRPPELDGPAIEVSRAEAAPITGTWEETHPRQPEPDPELQVLEVSRVAVEHGRSPFVAHSEEARPEGPGTPRPSHDDAARTLVTRPSPGPESERMDARDEPAPSADTLVFMDPRVESLSRETPRPSHDDAARTLVTRPSHGPEPERKDARDEPAPSADTLVFIDPRVESLSRETPRPSHDDAARTLVTQPSPGPQSPPPARMHRHDEDAGSGDTIVVRDPGTESAPPETQRPALYDPARTLAFWRTAAGNSAAREETPEGSGEPRKDDERFRGADAAVPGDTLRIRLQELNAEANRPGPQEPDAAANRFGNQDPDSEMVIAVVGRAGDESAKEPPPRETELVDEIRRFNIIHRELYGILRKTVGAGARNTVLACTKRMDCAAIFMDLTPDANGELDVAALLDRLRGRDAREARSELATLVRVENDFAAGFLDRRSLEHLAELLKEATESHFEEDAGERTRPEKPSEHETSSLSPTARERATEGVESGIVGITAD